jgi:hypothetical protein
MANNSNKKYVELIWADKYDRFELGKKMRIEKPNLPFQTVETVNKPRLKLIWSFLILISIIQKMNIPPIILKIGEIS